MDKFSFECCICNNGIIEDEIDPIDISIIFNRDMKNKSKVFQIFYAHFDCFKKILHPNIGGFFVRDDD